MGVAKIFRVKMNYPFKIPGSAPGLNDNICGVHSRLSIQ